MARKAAVKYRSLRSNLVHLPLSLYASLAQSQTRPQSIVLHLAPVVPVSASGRAPKQAYLGWSGLTAASSLAGGIGGNQLETIEVDPEVALNYGWAEGTILEISIIHNPTKARSVSVTPLSADDWEILEQNANYLEQHLLSQLRAAQKGQDVDVWVLGRTKIRIRVDATNPATTSSSVVLINADTEIYVAPRPRDSKGKASAPPIEAPKTIVTPQVSRIPSSQSVKPKGKPTPAAKEVALRLIPPVVANSWGSAIIPVEDAQAVGGDRAAWCAPSTLSKIRRRLESPSEKGAVFVNLRLLKKEEAEGNKAAEPEPAGEEEKVEEEEQFVPAWLVEWDEMPQGCVVLSGELEDEWSSWGIVQISLAKHGVRAKANGARLAPSLHIESSRVPKLAGVDDIIDNATNYLGRAAATGQARTLLLMGAKGSGKTAIAQAIGSRLEVDRNIMAETIYEDVGRLDPENRLNSLKESMAKWAEDAKSRKPCVLILDNLDLLLGPENELSQSSNPAILAETFCRLFATSNLPAGVMVLATATGSASLHPLLTSKHTFGESIKVKPPTSAIRREILQVQVQSQEAQLGRSNYAKVSQENALDYVTLATLTEGYSASDLNDFVAGASQQSMIRAAKEDKDVVHLAMDDFVSAQEAFTPLSLRGVALQKSDVRWSDIGGLHDPRQVLRETLEWPTKYAQIFANCPLRLRSGILLYGYPGCGKTLLASAVARECGLNFISVKGPEILNKYIGASEQSVRDLFERASAAKPCVLFFDEFDSIAPKRGHDSTGVTDRVVNQMLTEMDGAQGLDGVYVLAATSRPDLIDPALLRPGRLDKSVLCDMPSTEDRLEILQSFTRKLTLAPSVDLEMLANDTDGLSGADLQALVYNAHLDVVHTVLNHKEEEPVANGKGKGKEPVDIKGKGKGKEQVDVKGKGKEVVSNGKGKGKAPASPSDSDKENLPNGTSGPPLARFRQLQPAENVMTSAARAAFAERIDTIINSSAQRTVEEEAVEKAKMPTAVIEERHLRKALMGMRPSVSNVERARFERIYSEFVNDRDGNMSNGDLGRGTGTRTSLQ